MEYYSDGVPPTIRRSSDSSEVTAVLGSSTVLLCEAEGNPNPSITWLKDGSPSCPAHSSPTRRADAHCEWGATRSEDAGTYTCRASSPAGTALAHYTLSILGGQVLQIPRAQLEHGGRYTCQAVNEAGEDQMHFDLEVLKAPVNRFEVDTDEPTHSSPDTCGDRLVPPFAGSSRSVICDDFTKVLACLLIPDTVPPRISDQSEEFMEEVSAVVNSTVFLRCHVRGTPPPSVSWLKDGLLLHSNTHYHFQENGGVLEIVDVQVSDMAGYLCVAENKVGAVQKLYSLSVHVPPGIVGEREEAVSVVEGHMVSLLCDVQAYPAAEITWTRDGEVLQFSTGAHVLPGGQMLQLPRAQQQDAGQYVCTATNSAGQDQKSILLSVYGAFSGLCAFADNELYLLSALVPPTLLPHSGSEVMTPLLGSAVTLHCEVQGVPEPEVTWYHNGQQLTAEGGLLLNQQQLKIAGVQVADGGIYTCRVSNPAGQLERTFRLTVHVPPAVVGPLHETLAHTLGSRVRLVCDVTGVPTPAVSWLKDGTAIGVGVGVLDFGPLELSHAGTYTCVARNSEGQSEKNFSLTVHVSPTVVDVGPAEVSGFLGESLSLECRAEGSPAPHLRWFRNGAELDSTHSKHIDVSPDGHSLTIRNLRADDSGTFSCLAVSPAGQDSRIYTVFVLVPPVILGDGDVQIEPVEGSVVTLECKVTGTPPPQVSWFRDGQPLLLTPRTHVLPTHTVLRISRVSLSDSGLYVCVAQSRAGTAERRFHLQVPAPPTVDRTEPTEQVSVILGSVVTLSCEAHGVPPPTLTWLKDGRPLLFNHNQLPDGQETHFQLPAVSRSDSGLYSCLASNPAGSTTKAFNLTVLEPPRLVGQLGTEQKLVAVDGVLELECIAEGIPPPTLSWLKDGRPLEDSTAVVERNGQLLKINKAQVLSFRSY
ncbi:hypothetical protein SRHO_G00346280 [Serrasalmus rhombeus]